MKVCHITSVHSSTDIRIFQKECRSLAKAGYDVHLVAPNVENHSLHGVHIHGFTPNHNGRLSRMTKTAKQAYLIAKELNADLYHFHDPEILPHGYTLKKAGKIVIYDAHEDVPRQIMAKYWIPTFLRKVVSICFEKYENRIAKRLSAVVAATPHIANRFKSINPNSIDACNYPLLEELLEPSDWNDKENEICYVGGISEYRGIFPLLDAMKNLEVARLNLAGTFSPVELEIKVKNHISWKKTNFFGHVGRKEVFEIFKKSKIGVVTFLPGPNHTDAMPNKLFEYMSAGIPVVASHFPLWKDIVEITNCGICVDPENPKSIELAITNLMNDSSKAEQMGKNGREAVIKNYNWDTQSIKLISLYQKLECKR
jgi:glycosyltransferase involved in cell wall biosynthesis